MSEIIDLMNLRKWKFIGCVKGKRNQYHIYRVHGKRAFVVLTFKEKTREGYFKVILKGEKNGVYRKMKKIKEIESPTKESTYMKFSRIFQQLYGYKLGYALLYTLYLLVALDKCEIEKRGRSLAFRII